MEDAVSLQDRLDDYQVTEVPAPVRLGLSWSPPEPAAVAERVGRVGDDEVGSLAVLAAYRITRVPTHAS